jgi:uncharacterized membrane protein
MNGTDETLMPKTGEPMQTIVLYAATALVFAVLDALMLTSVMQPLFRRHIAPLMLDAPRVVPAVLFYAGYVAGLIALVSWPALRAGSVMQAGLNGAVLGAVAYGTYELTSYTIMRDWHPAMVVTDLVWGALLSGLSAAAGVWIVRRLFGV